jgi:hypothetical protein
MDAQDQSCQIDYEPVCLKVLFADLLWEKNTVSAGKTSWKVWIIRQANKTYIYAFMPK